MDYVVSLHRGIEKLVRNFQRNPYEFLYEQELQAILFGSLVEEFKDRKISMQGGYWEQVRYGSNDIIETVPVRCEYPSIERLDIAIIDLATVRDFDKANWENEKPRNDAFWNQPALEAVKIKYCQLGHKVASGKLVVTVISRN